MCHPGFSPALKMPYSPGHSPEAPDGALAVLLLLQVDRYVEPVEPVSSLFTILLPEIVGHKAWEKCCCIVPSMLTHPTPTLHTLLVVADCYPFFELAPLATWGCDLLSSHPLLDFRCLVPTGLSQDEWLFFG